MITIQQSNANAKRCLAVCNEQIAAIDAELDALVEKLVAGEVTALLAKVRELTLRERRAQAEAQRKAMLGAIKHF
jgi:DNA-binding FrmR family transcriptional regulator